MFQTKKRGISRVVVGSGDSWDAAVDRLGSGYCYRPAHIGLSPIELLYAVKMRLLANGEEQDVTAPRRDFRSNELLALTGLRASSAAVQMEHVFRQESYEKKFEGGNLVLAAPGAALLAAKWPAFKTNFYRLVVIKHAKHIHYELTPISRKRSRMPFHLSQRFRYFSWNLSKWGFYDKWRECVKWFWESRSIKFSRLIVRILSTTATNDWC